MGNQSVLIPLPGEYAVAPLIRLQPTAQRLAPVAAAGWSWRRRIAVTNGSNEPLVNFPYALDLSDTTGLTTAKALANGNDLRIWRQGREIARTLVDWDSATHDTLAWITLPYQQVGEVAVYDVVYGNALAGAPPALELLLDAPAFDLSLTGANRCHNGLWVYSIAALAANAGKGAWPLSGGTDQPRFSFVMPGSWMPATTLQSPDDRQQIILSTYEDGGTFVHSIFNARRARAGSTVVTEDVGPDGVTLTVPTGITGVTADFTWTNQAVSNSDATPIGRLVVVASERAGDLWFPLAEFGDLNPDGATIAADTYAPATPVKAVGCAVWPRNDLMIDFSSRSDRYVEAAWDTTLEVTLDDSLVTQEVLSESAWTPLDLGPEVFLFSPDIDAHPDGTLLALWPDSSGNGRNATQGTGAARPRYQTNELNGHPVVRFDGAGDSMATPSLGISEPYTVVMLHKDVSIVNGDRVWTFGADSGELEQATGGDYQLDSSGSPLVFTDVDASGLTWHTTVAKMHGANTSLRFDGTASAITGNPGTSSPVALFNLSAVSAGAQIDVAAALVFNRELTTEEAQRVEGFLVHTFGLAANLPASHPYKAAGTAPIYEIANEVRAGGGAYGEGPFGLYQVARLGNAALSDGRDTPRLAVEIGQHVEIDNERRSVAIWDSGLTAKVEDAPIPAYETVESVYRDNGDATPTQDDFPEQPDPDWLYLLPVRNPLTNPSFALGVTGWAVVATDAGITHGGIVHDTVDFDSTPGSATIDVTVNVAGAGDGIDVTADDYLPVGGQPSVWFGLAVMASNDALAPRLQFRFYDEALAPVGGTITRQAAAVAAVDAWERHVAAAIVPEGAIYWRPGIFWQDATGGTVGQVWWDTVEIGAPELALYDPNPNPGTLNLTFRVKPRFAYA